MTPTPTTPRRNGAASAFTAFTMDKLPPTHRPPFTSLACPESAGDRKRRSWQTPLDKGSYNRPGAGGPSWRATTCQPVPQPGERAAAAIATTDTNEQDRRRPVLSLDAPDPPNAL